MFPVMRMTQFGGLKAVGRKVVERFEDGFGGSQVPFIVFMKRRIEEATYERAAEIDRGKSELYRCSRETTSHQRFSTPQQRNGGKER
jgi:hypothetical protein